MPKLIDGTIDLTWGGPMRVMKAHDQDKHSPLVNFCEVVSHDPFFLIGKRGAAPFRLADLASKDLPRCPKCRRPGCACSRTCATTASTRTSCRASPTARCRATTTRSQAGDIEVMQAFEPFVSMAESDRAGDILYAASTRGPTAYTAFIATREACAKHRDEFAAMTRATGKMLAWLYANPAEELAAAGGDIFPDVPQDILASSLRRYKDAGLWSRETRMIPQGFARLAQSLHSGGFIARMPGYDECVEPTLNGIQP